MLNDLRLALRRLVATPVFTVFAVLSLAVGIGVTSVSYSIVAALFLGGPGVTEPDGVGLIAIGEGGRYRFDAAVSPDDFDDYAAAQTAFVAVAASTRGAIGFTSAAATEVLRSEAVSSRYFETLGVAAVVGRTIQPSDDDARVAVISHGLWRRRFGADPAAVGREVRIGAQRFEVIGVAPAGHAGLAFAEALTPTAVWIPERAASTLMATALTGAPDATRPPDLVRRTLTVAGRLRPGATLEQASAEAGAIAASLDASRPLPPPRAGAAAGTRRWSVRSVADLHEQAHETDRRLGIVLGALVLLVLVVACTNLSNLVLARGTTRQQEFAVRRALGAGRWRLVREQMAESLIVAVLGGLAAFLVMRVLAARLSVDIPVLAQFVISIQPAVDRSMALLAAAATLGSLVIFGLEPAYQLTRTADVRQALAAASGGLGAPKTKRQRVLLRWQVAVATGFFVLASMSVRFLFAEMGHDSGVDLDRIAVASLQLHPASWDDARARRALDRIMEEARRDPAIESVSVSTGVPFGTFGMFGAPQARFIPSGSTVLPGALYPAATLVAASPEIFRTLGIPILRGRAFDDRDRHAAARVVVLSETAARKVFGTTDAVGRELRMQTSASAGQAAPATVIGIAADTDSTYLRAERLGTAYAPIEQHPGRLVSVVARGASGQAVIGPLQRAIRTAEPDVPASAIGAGRDMLTGAYALLRGVTTASISLGLVTLTLAMIGLFGIQLHGVAHRTREIGVRLAVGATTGQIHRMVLRDGSRPVVEGLVLGVLAGLGGRAVIRAYLSAEISIFDPWMLVAVPIPMILAALCACWLPARSAARVEPMRALRDP